MKARDVLPPAPEEGWSAPGHEGCGPECQAKQIVKMAANLSESERFDPVSTRDGVADPAPVGLTEDEALILDEARELAPPDPDYPIPWDRYLLARLVAIIDRLTGAEP